jgi:hypothetical protein
MKVEPQMLKQHQGKMHRQHPQEEQQQAQQLRAEPLLTQEQHPQAVRSQVL